ncbi:MAG: dTDP-4-dehydrorhamnose reductase [Lachnospiraceae bacterium]|nr:dTDP-4-dehydrorhamnose reductase [Lachnospiraceae bacterium]
MSREKIWIAGADGRLGQAVYAVLDRISEYTVLTTDCDVDVTDLEQVMEYAVINRPSYILNCVGLTDPAYCEKNMIEAYRINALGPRNLAAASRRIGATIIQISTDDVFGGQNKGLLTEFDQPDPVTVYGKSKLAGEGFVRELNPKHIIIRSSWLYGFGEHDFVTRILNQANAGETITVPMDQISSPTSARELSRFVKKLLKSQEFGIFHASCEGECSRMDFVKRILQLAGVEAQVEGVMQGAGDSPVLRPCYTRLENLMMKMTGIYSMAPWEDALKEYMEDRKRS